MTTDCQTLRFRLEIISVAVTASVGKCGTPAVEVVVVISLLVVVAGAGVVGEEANMFRGQGGSGRKGGHWCSACA